MPHTDDLLRSDERTPPPCIRKSCQAGDDARTITNQPGSGQPPKPKRVASEARLRANRLNSQKSTGPRTEAGKQRSSLNALRHGFTGQVLSLPAEELAALQTLLRDFETHYQPCGTQERHLVHMLAQLQYRLHRLMASEHNLFAIGHVENSELWDVNHPEAHTGFVFADTIRRSKDPLLTLSIYEQRLMRQYEKVLKMLHEVQAKRASQEAYEEDDLYAVAMCHRALGKPFEPAGFGFVCSSADVDAFVKQRWTRERARRARECGFEREMCKPALAFSA
jgi:hypothetical protein